MKKILIVDDEKPISDIIKFNMTREGYEVVTAFDGREALEVFEAEMPDPGHSPPRACSRATRAAELHRPDAP